MNAHTFFRSAALGLWCFGLLPLSLGADIRIDSAKETPLYYYDIVTKAAGDTGLTELKLFVKIPHDELQFIRDGEFFKARYELTVIVLNASDEQVEGNIETRDVTVATFEETNASYSYAFAEVSFDLKPASYTLVTGLTDLDSDRGGQNKVEIDLIDYWKFDFSMSDLLLADTTYAGADGLFRLEPNVLWNMESSAKSLNLYFEIYSTAPFESMPIDVFVRNSEDQVVYEWKQNLSLSKFRTPVLQKIPKTEIQAGKYKIEIQVGSGKIITRRIKDLTIRWMNFPDITTDLNEAIDQLRYIANPGDIKEMKKAEGDAKKERFDSYWKSVDPTPDTEANELMIEYYRRIEYTNQHFAGFTEGWLSDRGLVYIVLGPPDDIELHPFEQDSKPYIIWSYYLQSRDFVFVDENGFGDYRLKNPLWEVYGSQ